VVKRTREQMRSSALAREENMQEHRLIHENGCWCCSVCQWTWKYVPRSQCPGVERFAFGEAPENYLTATQLRKLHLKPADPRRPDGCYWQAGRKTWLWFYDRSVNAVSVRSYRRKK
jgi:hypothetical protein